MSEIQLKQITKTVSTDSIMGISNVIKDSEDTYSFTINLKNGRTLNEFLPKGTTFLVDKGEPWYSPQKKVIHFDPELLNNQNYRAVLAHECGHSLVKKSKKTQLAYLQSGHEILYDGRFKERPLEERLKRISSLIKHNLDTEIDATNHGKIIADLIGIDPTVYEDMTTNSLQTHFQSNMQYLKKLLELSCPDLTDDTLVYYYNPFAQETRQITYGEFKTISIKAKEENTKTMGLIKLKVKHE